jgi:hypothetical protein
VVTAAIYFYNLSTSATAGSPHHGYVLQHPLVAIKFYIITVGDVVGMQIPYRGPSNAAEVVLGVVILVLAVVTMVMYGVRRDESGGGPIGVALIIVGLLFAAIVTVGRVDLGYWAASASRYTTFDLLTPVGIYLAALGRPTWWPVGRRRREGSEGGSAAAPRHRVRATGSTWSDRRALSIVRWVVAIVVAVQIVVGVHYGIEGARTDHASQVQAVHVLRNIDHESDDTLVFSLDFFEQASFIRHQAQIAQEHHLGPFSGR